MLDRLDQPLLALVEQKDDVTDVFLRQAGFLDDVLRIKPARQQQFYVGEDFQRSVALAGDVFRQRHDEGVLVRHIDHQGRNMGFAQQPEGIEPPFATNQQVALLAIGTVAPGDGDRLFEADGADVFRKRSPRPIDVFSLGRLTLFGMVRLCARQGVPGELISEGVATA